MISLLGKSRADLPNPHQFAFGANTLFPVETQSGWAVQSSKA
jgi:hypothetical protein